MMAVVQYAGAQEYFRSASDYARLYVGPIEPQYQVSLWHDIPYYKGNTNVYQGRISYHGVVYDEVQLRFDQLEQRVAVLTPVKGVFCLPEQACIDWFEMDGRRYVHDPEDGSRFAALLCDGSGNGVRLYHSVWKVYGGENSFGGKKYVKVLSTNEYYSLQTADGAIHHVKNARDVARIFPEQKGQIKQMAKQRHLSFSKKEREQSLVKVVEGVIGVKLFTVDSLRFTDDYTDGSNDGLASKSTVNRKLSTVNKIRLAGCTGNNLKHIDVEFPLGKLILVTGVSGSGKSTLINETLQPILSHHFYHSLKRPMPYDSIEGLEYIDKVVNVDQSPIGRTPRSNPATYTGVFADIRSLFVNLPEAKIRGYKPGRFSFNVKGGRCETCGGNGYKTIEMNFLPDIQVPCEACHGKRYNRETLEVRYKGKSIADVLDMTINQAVEFFENVPDILRKIKTIQDVGLGYIKLGQPSTTLSGGESQRIKLATELSKKDTGQTLYILDEPTTGLHFEDIRILMQVLRKLVDRGNTVIVIEHNLDVIRQADWIIDMGPEGGRKGGQILTVGTPAEVAQSDKGYTPKFLKK